MRLIIVTQRVDRKDPILGFFHAWIEQFSARFDFVEVICFYKGDFNFPDNVTVYSLGKEEGVSKLGQAFRFYRYMRYALKKGEVSYVFYHMGSVFNLLGVPFYVARFLYRPKPKFYWWKTHGKAGLRERIGSMYIDKVITATEKGFPINTPKKVVVGHAIDTKQLIDLGVHQLDKVILVGRVTPIKQVHTSLDIVVGENLSVSICGPIQDSYYKTKLDEQIESLLLQELVTFTGPLTIPELVEEYRTAGFLIHPAAEAGFDKVVLEAMATGVIPLTSIPAFKPILSPFKLYFEASDITGYKERLSELRNLSADELNTLRVQLREIVTNEHSLDTITKRIFDI